MKIKKVEQVITTFQITVTTEEKKLLSDILQKVEYWQLSREEDVTRMRILKALEEGE